MNTDLFSYVLLNVILFRYKENQKSTSTLLKLNFIDWYNYIKNV